jgi:HEAT repeat protein
VSVQTFRQVPIQVKATDGQSEKRIALDPRFGKVAREIQARAGGDFLKDRFWDDRGIRYGPVEEVARSVAEEIEALLDEDALGRILAAATGGSVPAPPRSSPRQLEAELKDADWRRRLRAVKEIGTDPAAIPLLTIALGDPKPEIRRWAAAGLGATGSAGAVAPLAEALRDPSVAVRRTAGDSLSDLGDASAQPAMLVALADPNKLVRWRAARFLAEVGTPDALPALEKAAQDPEFEVRREVEAAIERIRGGAPGSAPVWKRMSG